ncbi:MAG: hypothetical protein AAFR61_05085 [Bacteroidota bacterium]
MVSEIFTHLQAGGFLSENSQNLHRQLLFSHTQQEFPILANHFAALGYTLCKGEGYIYMLAPLMAHEIAEKQEMLTRYLAWYHFLSAYHVHLSPGHRLQPQRILEACREKPELAQLLLQLPMRASSAQPLERIKALLRQLEKLNLVEYLEAEDSYLVLSAFSYLQHMVLHLYQSTSSY